MISGFGGKLPTNSELMTPIAFELNQGKPLSGLIFDAREDPMNTPSIMNMQPAYDFHESNTPCLPATDLAGITNMRVKGRNPIPNLFGTYPQPYPGTRSKVFGLANNICDIENSDNKVLRKSNNFNPHTTPPFPEFKQ